MMFISRFANLLEYRLRKVMHHAVQEIGLEAMGLCGILV